MGVACMGGFRKRKGKHDRKHNVLGGGKELQWPALATGGQGNLSAEHPNIRPANISRAPAERPQLAFILSARFWSPPTPEKNVSIFSFQNARFYSPGNFFLFCISRWADDIQLVDRSFYSIVWWDHTVHFLDVKPKQWNEAKICVELQSLVSSFMLQFESQYEKHWSRRLHLFSPWFLYVMFTSCVVLQHRRQSWRNWRGRRVRWTSWGRSCEVLWLIMITHRESLNVITTLIHYYYKYYYKYISRLHETRSEQLNTK